MEAILIQNSEEAQETIALVREILGSGDKTFPEHLLGEITRALSVPESHDDMMRQLIRLCATRPDKHGPEARFVNGRLLYRTNEARAFVWGSTICIAQEGHTVSDQHSIQIIGEQPCWVEVANTARPRTERVVWGKQLGRSYPSGSIQGLQDCGGVPCYMVNLGNSANEYRGFVVLDETEGIPFYEVANLTTADNRPLYVGSFSSAAGQQAVWGTEGISHGVLTSAPIVIDGFPYVSILSKDGTMKLWRGREPILHAPRIQGPSIVNGTLAYAHDRDEVLKIMIGDKEIGRYPGPIHNWWTQRAQLDNAFVAYTVRTDAGWKVFANGTFLCDGLPMMKGFSVVEDGSILRVQFEQERHPRLFDLRALGIVPAEPAAT